MPNLLSNIQPKTQFQSCLFNEQQFYFNGQLCLWNVKLICAQGHSGWVSAFFPHCITSGLLKVTNFFKCGFRSVPGSLFFDSRMHRNDATTIEKSKEIKIVLVFQDCQIFRFSKGTIKLEIILYHRYQFSQIFTCVHGQKNI